MNKQTTREMIRKFNLAFNRPVHDELWSLTVTERELLGNLLLEEAVEYCVKGLGLVVSMYQHPVDHDADFFEVEHVEGARLNPIECADGLGDVNVVIHFAAHWQGFNLDAVTEAIHKSNMTKLGEDGKPIINNGILDPSKPVGKILKPSHYKDPIADITAIILTPDGNKA